MNPTLRLLLAVATAAAAWGCLEAGTDVGNPATDDAAMDSGGATDSGMSDTLVDIGPPPPDAAADSGAADTAPDTLEDAAPVDAGSDGSTNADAIDTSDDIGDIDAADGSGADIDAADIDAADGSGADSDAGDVVDPSDVGDTDATDATDAVDCDVPCEGSGACPEECGDVGAD